jgi:NAD(P)-dependent dehydrogenase (short-subunit alcohol dehydrogenase family)
VTRQPLSPRAILICGGTGSIGRHLVHTFAGNGHRVAFSGRNRERGQRVAAGSGAQFIEHDDFDGSAVVETAADLLGPLDGLVLNAGTIEHATLAATSHEKLTEMLHVNVTVPIRQVQTAALAMSPGGSIVAVASNAGLWPETEIGAYSVSKAALVAACRALATQYSWRGIRINAVCPGDTEPGMAATISGDHGFASLPPLGRLGKPADTAAVVDFLLSPESAFITGTSILVDGGMHSALDAGRTA